jgi:hypothetical protein
LKIYKSGITVDKDEDFELIEKEVEEAIDE